MWKVVSHVTHDRCLLPGGGGRGGGAVEVVGTFRIHRVHNC